MACAFTAGGQPIYRIQGVVADSAGIPLPGATVRIYQQQDTLSVISKRDGSFFIRDLKTPSCMIHVSLIGYVPADRHMMALAGSVVHYDTVHLKKEYRSLDTVVVTSVAPVVLKGDTVEFRTAAFAMREGDLLEDLVQKFPGVTRDMNGQYMALGQKVSKITLNGKDFFGDDMQVALQNLPADIIKSVQIVRDYGEESKLTGIKTGQPTIVLNIITRDDRKDGIIGRGTLGGGTNGSYLANGFANRFRNDLRLAVTGAANDVNTTAGGNNSQQSVGIQYGDKWSAVIAGNGHYQFSRQDNTTISNSVQRTLFTQGLQSVNTSSSRSNSHGTSHGVGYDFYLNPDKFNTITLNTRLDFSHPLSTAFNSFVIDQTDSLHHKITTGYTAVTGKSSTSSPGAGLLIAHRFKETGEVLTFNGSFNSNRSNQDNDNRNNTAVSVDGGPAVYTPLHQQVLNDNHGTNVSAKASYILPVNKQIRLLFTYGYIGSSNTTKRNTYSIDSASGARTLVDSLSNRYDFTQTTHQAGMGLNGDSRHLNYNLNLALQPVILSGNSVSGHFATTYRTLTFIPMAMLNYKVTKTFTLSMNYTAASNMPNLYQLRPVTDLSNPQYPVTGNPDLKPSYTHNLNFSLNKVNLQKGSFFSINLAATETQNSIVTNVINNPQATTGSSSTVIQETRYLNTNGVYSWNGSYGYSRPFMNKKLVMSLNGGLAYGNNVSYANNIRSLNANWTWNQGMQWRFTLPERLDLSASVSYSSNKTSYSPASLGNTTVNNLQLGLNGRYFFSRRLILTCDGNYVYTSGYSNAFNNRPIMVNSSLEQWFLKKRALSLKLQCYNLLNKQMGVSRSVSGNVITDNQHVGIGRYFMLTANLRFSDFSGKKKDK